MRDRTARYFKTPDAECVVAIDWTPDLHEGEGIADSSFEVSGAFTIEDVGATEREASIRVAGGRPGAPRRVTNRITTTEGRALDRSVRVLTVER